MDLYDAVKGLAADLRAADEVAAADRVQRVADGVFTTSSEWLGELLAALADARRLIAARDWRRQVAAHRLVEAVAARLPGSRLRRTFLCAALTVAYVLVLPPAAVAALWLLGASVPGTPPANLLLLCLMAVVAGGIALAILRHVPLAGRAWAREVMLLAVFAMLALAFAARA